MRLYICPIHCNLHACVELKKKKPLTININYKENKFDKTRSKGGKENEDEPPQMAEQQV